MTLSITTTNPSRVITVNYGERCVIIATLSVVILSAIILSVVMQSVIIHSVVMLSVAAPSVFCKSNGAKQSTSEIFSYLFFDSK
jgi:O-antigen ligase